MKYFFFIIGLLNSIFIYSQNADSLTYIDFTFEKIDLEFKGLEMNESDLTIGQSLRLTRKTTIAHEDLLISLYSHNEASLQQIYSDEFIKNGKKFHQSPHTSMVQIDSTDVSFSQLVEFKDLQDSKCKFMYYGVTLIENKILELIGPCIHSQENLEKINSFIKNNLYSNE